MVDFNEVKRLRDRAEECLALADIVRDPHTQESYRRMAEVYFSLARNAALKKPGLQAEQRPPRDNRAGWPTSPARQAHGKAG